jgi:hypothetical protein
MLAFWHCETNSNAVAVTGGTPMTAKAHIDSPRDLFIEFFHFSDDSNNKQTTTTTTTTNKQQQTTNKQTTNKQQTNNKQTNNKQRLFRTVSSPSGSFTQLIISS